jgi:hypothetical protein
MCILKGDVIFTENVQKFVDFFAAVAHPVEGLTVEALLKLKVEKSVICLVATRRLTVFITEEQSILLLLKTLIRNKASR